MNYVRFPPVSNANRDGLLAVGGDLNLDTLVSAYAQGIFPWFNHDQPILWWSPDPRLVLYPDKVHISKSLAKTMRQQRFQISCNTAFENVIRGCALRGNPPHYTAKVTASDTWITQSMYDAYNQLHQAGYAHSIEVWHGKELVGGLYGVVLQKSNSTTGKVFFGESMFSLRSNASKVALVALCNFLSKQQFCIIDCQVASDHLLSMGAQEIPRNEFLLYLENIDINTAVPDFADGFNQFRQ